MKANKSLYFVDKNGKDHFLFQVLNFGKIDGLKFAFNVKNEGTAIVYSQGGGVSSEKNIIKSFTQVTYHSDGYIHYKLPKEHADDKDDYRDHIKKTPLNQIREWAPIIKYTVVNYGLCKKNKSSERVVIPRNDLVFNGDPFECVIWLGHLQYATPPTNEASEIIFRLNNIAENIDLAVWLLKSSYMGKIFTIPNTNIPVFNRSNIVEIVEVVK